MRDSVRIVIVGDEKVGKTSIIEVLITEDFPETVQPVLPVLVVPKDVTPDQCHVSIVDTPGDPSQVSKVDAEVHQADVIVLVYAVDDMVSTNRVISHWLPKFRTMDITAPIVLVGNKIDTRGGVADPDAAAKMEAFIKPIMEKFKEVDVCIECSAKTLSNISEVFYFAQKAVLYPTGPVYDVETHSLKPRATAALKRIFRICDKDQDGGLNDSELNEFQFHCFKVRLQPAEVEGVKRVVREACPEYGLRSDGSLSINGFIYLHTLFVQKGRLETTWIVLRKFDYDDELRLKIEPEQLPPSPSTNDQYHELTEQGISFLRQVFESCDKDRDGLLSPEELASVFEECPDGIFAQTKLKTNGRRLVRCLDVTGKGEFLSFESFVVRFQMLVEDSIEDAIRCLLVFGYSPAKNVANTVKLSKSRRRERIARSVARRVLHVAVFGADGPMKTDIIRGLVGLEPRMHDEVAVMAAATLPDEENTEPNGATANNNSTTTTATTTTATATTTKEDSLQSSRTLVMRYITDTEEAALLNRAPSSSSDTQTSRSNPTSSTTDPSSSSSPSQPPSSSSPSPSSNFSPTLQKFDVACIVFDVASQESLAAGLEVFQALWENKVKLPVVFVGAFGYVFAADDGEYANNPTANNNGMMNGSTTNTVNEDGHEYAPLAMADALCLERNLPTPTRVSVSDGDYGKLYEDLLGVALYPQVACPHYYDDVPSRDSSVGTVIKITGGVAVAAVAIYAAKKLYDMYFATNNTAVKSSGGGSKP